MSASKLLELQKLIPEGEGSVSLQLEMWGVAVALSDETGLLQVDEAVVCANNPDWLEDIRDLVVKLNQGISGTLSTPMGENLDGEDDEHPLWCINAQIQGLLEGEGATEDHEAVLAFLRATGLPESTVKRMHNALVFGDTKVIPEPLHPDLRMQRVKAPDYTGHEVRIYPEGTPKTADQPRFIDATGTNAVSFRKFIEDLKPLLEILWAVVPVNESHYGRVRDFFTEYPSLNPSLSPKASADPTCSSGKHPRNSCDCDARPRLGDSTNCFNL